MRALQTQPRAGRGADGCNLLKRRPAALQLRSTPQRPTVSLLFLMAGLILTMVGPMSMGPSGSSFFVSAAAEVLPASVTGVYIQEFQSTLSCMGLYMCGY